MKKTYKIGMIAGLTLLLGCKPKLLLEKAPQEFTVNSAGELSDIMNGFGTDYINQNIKGIDVPQHPTFEIRVDVDHDGLQDIAFRAGDIGYYRDEPTIIYYAIHSSELSMEAERKYQKEVQRLKKKGEWKSSDLYGIGLNEIKLNYPLKWHKKVLDHDGI